MTEKDRVIINADNKWILVDYDLPLSDTLVSVAFIKPLLIREEIVPKGKKTATIELVYQDGNTLIADSKYRRFFIGQDSCFVPEGWFSMSECNSNCYAHRVEDMYILAWRPLGITDFIYLI